MIVVVMRIPLALDPRTFERLLLHTSEEKRGSVKRYKFHADACRTLIADLLIRLLLCQEYDLSEREIRFERNPYGKPFLSSRPELYFNLSHSGEWVTCALGASPVGVDIERVDNIDLSVAEHFFSREEYRDLLGARDPLHRFYEIWTSKESYVKMLGVGLGLPLQSFSIKIDDLQRIRLVRHDGTDSNAAFFQYDVHPQYKLSLCVNNQPYRGVSFKQVSFKSLCRSFQ
jgi:4'-phosphopantetheinyl transferase